MKQQTRNGKQLPMIIKAPCLTRHSIPHNTPHRQDKLPEGYVRHKRCRGLEGFYSPAVACQAWPWKGRRLLLRLLLMLRPPRPNNNEEKQGAS